MSLQPLSTVSNPGGHVDVVVLLDDELEVVVDVLDDDDGASVGASVGPCDGFRVGPADGPSDGDTVGTADGLTVGLRVGYRVVDVLDDELLELLDDELELDVDVTRSAVPTVPVIVPAKIIGLPSPRGPTVRAFYPV